MASKLKETDLFEPVKQYFEERGYTVYSEVQAGRRADVVAVMGHCIVVIELKTSLSFDLLEQATDWTKYADYVWVAVPEPRGYFNRFAKRILKQHGIGLLGVFHSPEWTNVRQHLTAKQTRSRCSIAKNWFRDHITEYHKDHLPGGSAGGGYITQYKITMMHIKEFLTKQRRWSEHQGHEGWVSIKEILEHCETHYASPKQSLGGALASFEGDWCEVKIEGGKRYFRAKKGA